MDARTLSPQLPQWLLPWYEQNKRDLPWRRDREPYHIWVSEIMLQQTRVEAVKGYYTRFLAALPDIPALAACDDDAPTTGEIVLDIEKYMYVQSISIYTELGNKIYENREYLYEGGRLSIPLNPGNYRISTYGYSDCTFQIQAGHTTRIDYDQHGNGVVTYD